MTIKRLSVHEVLNEVKNIAEYLSDMGIAFMDDLTEDDYANIDLITPLNSIEVMEVLSYLFGM
jgi:hypothetical protein